MGYAPARGTPLLKTCVLLPSPPKNKISITLHHVQGPIFKITKTAVIKKLIGLNLGIKFDIGAASIQDDLLCNRALVTDSQREGDASSDSS